MIELIRQFYPEFQTKQAIEQLRKLFMECDASQAADLMRKFFPDADQTQVIGSIRFGFGDLSPNDILALSQKSYPESNANEVIGLLVQLFPGLHYEELFSLAGEFYPRLAKQEVLRLFRKSLPRFDIEALAQSTRQFCPEMKVGEVIQLIRENYPELTAVCSAELVRQYFPEVTASQFLEVLKKSFSGLEPGQLIGLAREFPRFDSHEVIGLLVRLFRELNATETAELIRGCFPELSASQITGVIRQYFPELSAGEMMKLIGQCFAELSPNVLLTLTQEHFTGLSAEDNAQLIHQSFPDLNTHEAMQLMKEDFGELDANEILELFCHCFPEVSAGEAVKLIRQFFPEWTAVRVVSLLRRFFPGMDTIAVLELMRRFFVDLGNLPDASGWLLGEGILAKLVKQRHCDIHKCKLVKIKASTTFKDFIATHAADIGSDQVFISADKPNQWLRYIFKGHLTIRPIGYLFESASRDYARELVVEGSEDGKSWFELSHWQNDLIGAVKVKVRTPCSHYIQMVRLRQVGMNDSRNHRLAVRSFDIFGYMRWDIAAGSKNKSTADQIARLFPEIGLGGSGAITLIDPAEEMMLQLRDPPSELKILFGEFHVNEVVELIRRFFPEVFYSIMPGKGIDGLLDTFRNGAVRVFVPPPDRRGKKKRQAEPFPPSVKKVTIRCIQGYAEVIIDVPDGIIAHLTTEYGGNVHDCDVVEVTSGSFERETYGAWSPAKYATDLGTGSQFHSAYRDGEEEDIPHTRNNWLCYDFKERRIVPTHYTIRTCASSPGGSHLKSWVVETSADGESWREVAREDDNNQLNGAWFTGTFAVAGGGECRCIRLVNVGKTHSGWDILVMCAWEIFGSLIE